MLTYMEVHLYYTLPVLAILFFLLRPFHSSQDQLKYVFLSIIAFLTASPWDNYIVYHRAWWYCPTCVTAVVGYVPLEEYMFFIIMSLMTVAFTNLVMRWRLPSAFIKPITPLLQSICIRLIPIIAFLCIAVKAWDTAVPDTRLFYGSCILWYVCPVMALLWYGAGEYMLRRCQSVLISIVLPTIYLCWVDTVAIGAGTWHISLRTSTGRMVAPNLPLEEFMFFALINTILVFATCAIDRAQAILHIYSPQDVSSFNLIQLTKAFLLPDQALDNQLLNDIDTTWRILRKASFSFYTASAVFSLNIRQDLGILYGFCRATDDLADCEEVPLEKRKEQLVLAREFVKDMFTKTEIDWNRYKGRLPDSCIASFRAFTRLRPVLEIEAVNELLDGYAWDLERRPVTDEKDLVKYSACVASSVGEMCTRLILATSANRNCDPSIKQWTIARARDMGLALQFTNIARDIVTDSQQLGRSYVPRVWLSKQEYDDLVNHSARKLGDERLRELALQLINGAAEIAIRANRGIDRLPSNCQGGVRAACAVYNAIGDAVKEAHGYPDRAHVRGLKRAWIVFKNVYGFSQWKYQPIQMSKERKGKQRAFFVE